MKIGIVGYKLERDDYYRATIECLASVYYDCNDVTLILHDTIDEARAKIKRSFPRVSVVCNPLWGNNLSAAWNSLLDDFFTESSYAVLLNNDVVVDDGRFTWFSESDHGPSGIVSARNRAGEPEYIFSAFVIFKWLYDRIGRFDTGMPVSGNDHDYLKRLKEIGMDVYSDVYSENPKHSDNKFVVFHHRSLTMKDTRVLGIT